MVVLDGWLELQEQELQQKKHGNAFAAGAAKWAEGLDSMEDTPMVQLGDASTAAPFTTRTPSIGSVVDIIRQGRCTLLSAVQQSLGALGVVGLEMGEVPFPKSLDKSPKASKSYRFMKISYAFAKKHMFFFFHPWSTLEVDQGLQTSALESVYGCLELRMQMMMLESMIAAYTMSTMSVDGTRPSEPPLNGLKQRLSASFLHCHSL